MVVLKMENLFYHLLETIKWKKIAKSTIIIKKIIIILNYKIYEKL